MAPTAPRPALSPLTPHSHKLNRAVVDSPDLLRVLSPASPHPSKLPSKQLSVTNKQAYSPAPAEPSTRPAGAIWQRVRRAQAAPSPNPRHFEKRQINVPPKVPVGLLSDRHVEVETQHSTLLIKRLDEADALQKGDDESTGVRSTAATLHASTPRPLEVHAVPETPAMERQLRGLDEAFKTPINAGRVLGNWHHVYDVPFHTTSEEHSEELPPASQASFISIDVAAGHDLPSLEEELQAFLSLPSVPSRPWGLKESTSPQDTRHGRKGDSNEKHEQHLEAANAHIRSLHFQITQLRAEEDQVIDMLTAKCRTLEQKLAAADGIHTDEVRLKDLEKSPLGTARTMEHKGAGDRSKDQSVEELNQMSRDIGSMRQQMVSVNQEVAGIRAVLTSAQEARRGGGGVFGECEGDMREKLHELCADVAEIKRLLARRSTPRLARDLVSAEETSKDAQTGDDAGGDTRGKRSRRVTRGRVQVDESVLTWEDYARWHCRQQTTFCTPPRDSLAVPPSTLFCERRLAAAEEKADPAPSSGEEAGLDPQHDAAHNAGGGGRVGRSEAAGGAGVLGWLLTPRAMRTIQLVRHRLSRGRGLEKPGSWALMSCTEIEPGVADKRADGETREEGGQKSEESVPGGISRMLSTLDSSDSDEGIEGSSCPSSTHGRGRRDGEGVLALGTKSMGGSHGPSPWDIWYARNRHCSNIAGQETFKEGTEREETEGNKEGACGDGAHGGDEVSGVDDEACLAGPVSIWV